MIYPTVRLAFFAIAIITAMGLLTTTVQAIDQGGLGGRPARPTADNPRSQSIFVHTLSPNTRTTDAVQVINNAAETKKVLIYAVDSQVSSGGAFACAQAADKSLSVGKWISLAQAELTLAPSSKQTIEFSLTVPKGTTPGEHNGCIVIQDTKPQSAPDNNGIVLSMRSAIRVAVTVPGKIQKGLVFTGLGFDHKTDEKLVLSTALKNNGNVSLDTQLEVKLLYPLGMSVAISGGKFPVLSASEGQFNFETSRPFWGGWYRLAAYAHYDDNPSHNLGEGKPTATIERSSWVYIAPQPLALILEIASVILLLGGAGLLLSKKKKHQKAMKHATTHIVRPHENLHTIADHYDMSWRHLAHINKLKAPYQLKPGQKLLVTLSQPSSEKTSKRP